MKPSIGRIVLYKLTGDDAAAINRRREDFAGYMKAIRDNGSTFTGYTGHTGNRVHESDVFPAMIVSVWSQGFCNLQVFLDGNDVYWATSRKEGDDPGQWKFPEIIRESSAVTVSGQITDEQAKEIALQVQAELLKRAKKSSRTAIPLNPHHEDIKQQMLDAVIQPPGDDGSL